MAFRAVVPEAAVGIGVIGGAGVGTGDGVAFPRELDALPDRKNPHRPDLRGGASGPGDGGNFGVVFLPEILNMLSELPSLDM